MSCFLLLSPLVETIAVVKDSPSLNKHSPSPRLSLVLTRFKASAALAFRGVVTVKKGGRAPSLGVVLGGFRFLRLQLSP